jgi:hypothetical protein
VRRLTSMGFCVSDSDVYGDEDVELVSSSISR